MRSRSEKRIVDCVFGIARIYSTTPFSMEKIRKKGIKKKKNEKKRMKKRRSYEKLRLFSFVNIFERSEHDVPSKGENYGPLKFKWKRVTKRCKKIKK